MTTRPFTGRHMTMIVVAFFAVVIGVNVTMARYAVSTFGGTVVENSYVASQEYNGWLERAQAQRNAGWDAQFTLDSRRRPVVRLSIPEGVAVPDRFAVTATHILGRASPVTLHLARTTKNLWVGDQALPSGRWQVQIDIPAADPSQPHGPARFREIIG